MDQLEEKYNIAIVGAGPSTTSLLYQLLKKSKLPEYLGSMCILEKSQYFGSGNYEYNTTYSNGNAVDSLQLMVLESEYKNSKTVNDANFWEQPLKQNQSTMQNQEKIDDPKVAQEFVNPLQIYLHIAKTFRLECNGIMQRISGDTYLSIDGHIWVEEPAQKFRWLFHALALKCSIETCEGHKRKINILAKQGGDRHQIADRWTYSIENTITRRAIRNQQSILFYQGEKKTVILCVGRQQEQIPQSLQFQQGQLRLYSEQVTQEQGLIKVYRQLNTQPNQKKEGRVIIIGNGQKAFECAHLLLNGPTIYRHDETNVGLANTNFAQKRITCEKCCNCNNNKQGQKKKPVKCHCDCICYGSLKMFDYKWHMSDVVVSDFYNQDIWIIGDEQPLVYFKNEQECKEARVYELYKDQITQQEQINPLCGLRGKAKDLYLQILKGEEKKCKILNNLKEIATEFFKNAQVIIDSRGSKVKHIPIKDMDGNSVDPLTLHYSYAVQQQYLINLAGSGPQKEALKIFMLSGLAAMPTNKLTQDQSQNDPNVMRIQGFIHQFIKFSLSHLESAKLNFLNSGIKLIDENFKNKPQGMIQTWFDANEFPRSGQSSVFIGKGDFDSDSNSYLCMHSINSELVEQESIALNSLDQELKQDKKAISFDSVEKMIYKKQK